MLPSQKNAVTSGNTGNTVTSRLRASYRESKCVTEITFVTKVFPFQDYARARKAGDAAATSEIPDVRRGRQ